MITSRCYGINGTTGLRVAGRHKWDGVRCEYCGLLKRDVTVPRRAAATIPLDHCGTILLEEFMQPKLLNRTEVARGAGIALPVMTRILEGKQPITGLISQKLGSYFGVDFVYFFKLQRDYDRRMAARKRRAHTHPHP